MKKIITLSLTTLFLSTSCMDEGKPKSNEEKQSFEEVTNTHQHGEVSGNTHEIVVTEKMSAGGYIYLKVTEKDNDYWMAVPDREVEVGATYYYDGGMAMKNFESKTLKRTFDSVIFAEGIRGENSGVKKVEKSSIQQGETSVEKVEKAPNGISIAELFENPKSFADKQVIIRGQVVKVNNGVMNVNFVHLQDGTTGNGQFDITITSLEEFKVGEVVTIKGSVTLNKDFGAGYVYDVLIEKAVSL